jgi:hypothetical protein
LQQRRYPVASDASALSLNDPTSLDWGIAWCRRILADTQEPPVFSDDELEGGLRLLAKSDAGVTPNKIYFYPHKVALSYLETDPDRVMQFSAGSYSQTDDINRFRTGIQRYAAAIESLIYTKTGGRLGSTSTGSMGVEF